VRPQILSSRKPRTSIRPEPFVTHSRSFSGADAGSGSRARTRMRPPGMRILPALPGARVRGSPARLRARLVSGVPGADAGVLGGGVLGADESEEERERAGVGAAGRPRSVAPFAGKAGRKSSVASTSGWTPPSTSAMSPSGLASSAIWLGERRACERARFVVDSDADGASKDEQDDSSNVRFGLRNAPRGSGRRCGAPEREGGGDALREGGSGTDAGGGDAGVGSGSGSGTDSGLDTALDVGFVRGLSLEDGGLVRAGDGGGDEAASAGRSRTNGRPACGPTRLRIDEKCSQLWYAT
jgi:hypothetical protein